ncbi:MAG: hypothetical protein R3E32_16870 [Chitinophagales bacterium]
MNNFNFLSNFKWFLSFCLVGLLSLSSNFALAQPDSFTIAGCSVTGADGNYTRDAADALGCPCYNNSNGGILVNDAGGWSFSSATCSNPFGVPRTLLYNSDSGNAYCDISAATNATCAPSTTLILAAPSASIPPSPNGV